MTLLLSIIFIPKDDKRAIELLGQGGLQAGQCPPASALRRLRETAHVFYLPRERIPKSNFFQVLVHRMGDMLLP